MSFVTSGLWWVVDFFFFSFFFRWWLVVEWILWLVGWGGWFCFCFRWWCWLVMASGGCGRGFVGLRDEKKDEM